MGRVNQGELKVAIGEMLEHRSLLEVAVGEMLEVPVGEMLEVVVGKMLEVTISYMLEDRIFILSEMNATARNNTSCSLASSELVKNWNPKMRRWKTSEDRNRRG